MSLDSPQVIRDERGISYTVFPGEDREPPHVHVHKGSWPAPRKGRCRSTPEYRAKFWLQSVRLAKGSAHGFTSAELKRIQQKIELAEAAFLEAWYAARPTK